MSNSRKYKDIRHEDVINWFYDGIRTPYVISMSRCIDKLYMWETIYGHGGEGVCLVFDFSDMIYNHPELYINTPLPIVYGEQVGFYKMKNWFIRLLLNEYLNYVQNVSKKNTLDDIIKIKLQTIESFCAFFSTYFKDERWHNEREIRMMCTIKEENSQYVKTNENNKKYVDVPIPLSCVKKIIAGPTISKTAFKEIMSYSQVLGLKPEDIYKSDEPLRKS